MNPYVDIAIRSVSVYFFMIIGLRLFGKNQLSQLNAGDVILLLLISNAVQNAMVGTNTSLQGGIVAALVLFMVNFFLKKIMYKSKTIRAMVESQPIVLIRDGVLDEVALDEAELTISELRETLREHGVAKVNQVQLAILEVDGNVSVISKSDTDTTHYTKHKKKFPKRISF